MAAAVEDDATDVALTHFFRTDNLIALRELALRVLADETDDELLEYLRQHEAKTVWETAERILVAVTAEPGNDGLLRPRHRPARRVRRLGVTSPAPVCSG
jgi:two-component system, OmpR family, sensor histidine kinase KdpD